VVFVMAKRLILLMTGLLPKNDRFWRGTKVRCADGADLRCVVNKVRFSEFTGSL
jgi:hypothetical protein